MHRTHKHTTGFTLVELLVSISILILILSITLASINVALMKARDAQQMADLKSVSLALELYFNKYGTYPPSPNNCCSYEDHNANFESMAGYLVLEGFLPSIPKSPGPVPYLHYKYPSNYPTTDDSAGSLLIGYLEAKQPTTDAFDNSCRPFEANWCSQTVPSSAYCLCHPY